MRAGAAGLAICIALAVAGAGAAAAQEEAADGSDERARSLLKGMADYMAALESFSFEAHTEYDVLQESSKTLEFGGVRRVEVRRPDRMRVRLEEREGARREVLFDGKRIVLYSPDKRLYAEVSYPGALEPALEYTVERLAQPAPLAEFVRRDLWELVSENIESALYVAETTIEGVPCHHLAFANAEVDWQLWVSRDDPPLARRVAITYNQFEGSPRFRARFTAWNVRAKLPDSVFAFEPPPGVNRIPVVAESPPDEPEGEAP
jgi:hypothetical protein